MATSGAPLRLAPASARAVVRAAIVHGDPVLRGILAGLVLPDPTIELVGEAAGTEGLADVVSAAGVDVVLLAASLADPALVGALVPGADVVVVDGGGGEEPAGALAVAMAAGARGVVVVEALLGGCLGEVLGHVRHGGCYVSPSAAARLLGIRGSPPDAGEREGEVSRREAQVLDLIAAGRTNADIAAALHITEKTVKNHITRAYGKLGARDRAEAVARWAARSPTVTPLAA